MRAVVLSGGLTLDFRTTRACLEEMLSASGFGVEVFDGTAGAVVLRMVCRGRRVHTVRL